MQAYYLANKPAIQAYKKAWAIKNGDRKKAQELAWVAVNKVRVAEKNLAWREENREHYAAQRKAYREANREVISAKKKADYATDGPVRRERAAQWKRDNPDKVNAYCAKRKAARRMAVPAWSNSFFIAEIYELAQLRTRITGVEHHVDHVVPLRSRLVCGLHTHDNLAVIPWYENVSKGNRHWPDMPSKESKTMKNSDQRNTLTAS